MPFTEFEEGLCSWRELLKEFTSKPIFLKIYEYVKNKYETEKCYPPQRLIFNAFTVTNLLDLKVVIVGQDPYHQPGQAMGLSFSVAKTCKIPPSLVNIYKAIEGDPNIKNFKTPEHGDLTGWAKQGVFLLNNVLTVTHSNPNSHKDSKWEDFTAYVIKCISKEKSGIVFMLWGKPAQTKEAIIDNKKHLVLKTSHPSPYSANAGFLTSKHFSLANEYLKKNEKKEINWNLD